MSEETYTNTTLFGRPVGVNVWEEPNGNGKITISFLAAPAATDLPKEVLTNALATPLSSVADSVVTNFEDNTITFSRDNGMYANFPVHLLHETVPLSRLANGIIETLNEHFASPDGLLPASTKAAEPVVVEPRERTPAEWILYATSTLLAGLKNSNFLTNYDEAKELCGRIQQRLLGELEPGWAEKITRGNDTSHGIDR